MTAQTTDFSGLLYYNPTGPGFNAVPQVTIFCPDSMDEGDTITVNLVTWGIPDGTVLYHVFSLFGTNLTSDRFNVSLHPVVENNRASFTVEVSADNTTSPDGQSFDIVIKKTLTGPALATKYGVNVNDTSQTPIPTPTAWWNGIYLEPISEGSEQTIDIGYSDWDGSTIYWEVYSGTSNSADFNTTSGTFTNLTGSGMAKIHFTPTADATTEGTETYYVKVGTTLGGNEIAGDNSGPYHISDTSVTPSPTYTLAKAGNVSSINEGAALTFNVTTTNVADGTTLYFYVGSTGAYEITAGRFSQGSGSSFTVTGNAGTFDITISANSSTATDTQSYNVQLSTTFSPPTFVGSAVSVTVNDTSQDLPPSPVSFLFNGSNQYIEVQGSTTDWDLVNGTIEFWIKATAASTGPRAIMTQRPSVGIDIFLEGGYLKVPNTSNGYIQWTEPTPGIWTHVAIVSLSGDTYVFYNGVYQGHQTGQAWANTSDTIYIGRRQGAFQYFDGKLYGIRITNSNLYVDPFNVVNFNPYATVLPPAKVSYTTLLLNPTDYAGLVDLSDSHHTLNAFASNDDDQPAGTGRHTLRVTTPNNGTSAGSAYFTISNYPAVASIPVGATVQSDVFDNSQISFLVMSRVWPFGGGGNLWQVSYDPIPGGTRATVPGDSFIFTW